MMLALEEAVTNVINHAFAGLPPPHLIRVRLDITAELFAAEVIDNGQAFDPTTAPDPDLTLPLEQRTPGGLGIHLMRNVMDRLQYRHERRQQYAAAGKGALTPPDRSAYQGAEDQGQAGDVVRLIGAGGERRGCAEHVADEFGRAAAAAGFQRGFEPRRAEFLALCVECLGDAVAEQKQRVAAACSTVSAMRYGMSASMPNGMPVAPSVSPPALARAADKAGCGRHCSSATPRSTDRARRETS